MARKPLTARAKVRAERAAADREATLTLLGGRGDHCYSLREVAKALGVTHQRVEQIEKAAMRKLLALFEAGGP